MSFLATLRAGPPPPKVALLRTMCLIHHCDNVATVVQNASGLSEFENRGNDDLACVLLEQAL